MAFPCELVSATLTTLTLPENDKAKVSGELANIASLVGLLDVKETCPKLGKLKVKRLTKQSVKMYFIICSLVSKGVLMNMFRVHT